MTTTTKRGFHLPWGNDDRDPDADGSAAASAPTAAGSGPAESAATADRAGGVRAALRNGPTDELGHGPFDLAPNPGADADVRPGDAPSDDLVDNAEILKRPPDRGVPDQEAPVQAQPPADAPADPKLAWPDVDRAGSSTHLASDTALPPVRPPVVVKGEAGKPGRRDNALVVGLVKAMRDAARATRQETTTRMRVAATTRIDELRAAGTVEAAALRKRADEDVVAVREWSKTEMARIRDEAEQRIAGRKAQLAREASTHTSEIERVVDEVKAAATSFEADMERFFEVLLAEEDPARLATLAERVPEAPIFAKLSPAARSANAGRGGTNERVKPARSRTAPKRGAAGATEPQAASTASPSENDLAEARLEPDAAAAAEAEAIAGLDVTGLDADPATEPNPEIRPETSPEAVDEPGDEAVTGWGSGSLAGFLATAPRIDSPDDLSPEERIGLLGLDPGEDADPMAAEPESLEFATESATKPIAELAPGVPASGVPASGAVTDAPPAEEQTKLVVSGLTSVAGISAFKSALNRVPGVASVSVNSGHEDDFIFAVNHTGGTDLRRAVGDFSGFSAQMTFDDGSIINWTVSEPGA
jgi:hypothetical protein